LARDRLRSQRRRRSHSVRHQPLRERRHAARRMKNEKESMSTEPVIQIRDLRKVFYTEDIETHALGGIDLTLDRGAFVAIVGPSGSGKTTLLAILGLMDRPTSGEYKLRGAPVEKLGDAELARVRNEQVGFIFQTFNLIGDLSVEQNVALPLVYRRVPQ